MALTYLWVPAIVVGHLLALCGLIYGLQHGVHPISLKAVGYHLLRLDSRRRSLKRPPAGTELTADSTSYTVPLDRTIRLSDNQEAQADPREPVAEQPAATSCDGADGPASVTLDLEALKQGPLAASQQQQPPPWATSPQNSSRPEAAGPVPPAVQAEPEPVRPASGSPFAALATAESVEPKPESDLHVRALIKKYESGSQPSSAGSHQPQPALVSHAAPPAPTSPSFQDSEVDTPMSHPIDRFSTESESFEPATGGHTQDGVQAPEPDRQLRLHASHHPAVHFSLDSRDAPRPFSPMRPREAHELPADLEKLMSQGSSSLPELRKQPTSKDFSAVVDMSDCESAASQQGPLTRTRLVSINGDDEAPTPVTLTWADVGCALSSQYQHRQVLFGATGQASPGELVGLMGPSGAGKSTLLDIISGRKSTGHLSGHITCNGHRLDHRFKRLSAYVPQEDVFVPTLSVWETLRFAARLSLPPQVSRARSNARCEQTLAMMGLKRVRDTKVGGNLPGGLKVRGLSGGEKRRLRIACALIKDPSIIFLDEPTSGLDAHSAWSVLRHLSLLAANGRTLCASLHQPRAAIWDSLHKVGILSEGRCVYYGRPDGVVPWFNGSLGYPYDSHTTSESVPDWIIDVVSINFVESGEMLHQKLYETLSMTDTGKLADLAFSTMTSVADVAVAAEAFRLQQSLKPQPMLASTAVDEPEMQLYAASWRVQFTVNLQRCMLAQLRNPCDAAMRLIVSMWVGLIIGLVFYDPQPRSPDHAEASLGLLFALQLVWALFPFMYTAFLQADRQYYATDAANGLYRPSAYYTAVVTAQTPAMVCNIIIASLIAYGMGNLNHSAAAIVLSSLLLATGALASMQMLMFCTLVAPNSDVAFALATAILSTSLMLGGFFIQVHTMHLAWIRGLTWTSFTRHLISGLFHIELAGQYSTCGGPSPGTCASYGDQVLDGIGLNEYGTGVAFAAQTGYYLLWVFLGYLALLRLKDRC